MTPQTNTDLIGIIDRIAIAQNELRSIKDKLDAEIIKVRDRYRERIEALEDEVKGLTKLARPYVTKHRRALLGDKQSSETAQARYGFQKSKPSLTLIKGWTEEDIIHQLRETRHPHADAAIIVKEHLTRNALTTLTDSQLEEIGLHRKVRTTFYVEPKQDNATRQTA